jgi:transcription factor IIIB subunit 2
MPPIVRPPSVRIGGVHGLPPKVQRRPRNPKPGGAAPPPKCCENPDPQDEDGVKICKNCFTELQNVNITAEVTFEDQAGGRSTVQGGLVGENARFSKTLGAGAYRRIGGGERNSMVEIENAGRRALASLAAPLKIPDNITQQAASVWSLAALNNFMAGRRTDEVAAACMWAACRRQKENDVLLMDMAEILRINVFRLGEVYKDLCEKLFLEGKPVGYQHFVEMEPLIKKYCQKLQFGDKTNQVGYDALRIMRRMNRDWIVSGRHPAGLCGACIILAARMNNFQRSVREVVYVSKVADGTIAKRVEEFRRTKSAALTVEQFREFGNRMLFQHDPPSLHEAEAREQKRQKRRAARAAYVQENQARQQSVISIADDESDVSSRFSSVGLATPPPTQPAQDPFAAPVAQMTSTADDEDSANVASRKRSHKGDVMNDSDHTADDRSKRPRTSPSPSSERAHVPDGVGPSQEPRFDADGFAIPALPIDPKLLGDGLADVVPTRRPRGRPKKATKEKSIAPLVVEISEEELADENYLEEQISQMLEDGQIEDAQNEVISIKEQERIEAEADRARVIAAEQQKIDAAKAQQRREEQGFSLGDAPRGEEVTAAELEEEFKDDIEVGNCLLSPHEIRTKERIWVTHNEDWLRKQAEKEMLQSVAKATGMPSKGKRSAAAKKKRSKIGDRSVLADHETPIESPADAAKAMLDRRAPQKSQHVDFSALQRIYGRTSQTPSRDAESGDASPVDEQNSRERSESVDFDGQANATDDRNQNRRENQSERRDDNEGSPAAGDGADEQDDAAWDNAQDDEDEDEDIEDEDPEEADYRTALQLGLEEDEFGVVDNRSHDEDDYDEYE